MKQKKLMVYGATGYTGAMVAKHAYEIGLSLILGGRDNNQEALNKLGQQLNTEVRCFTLDDEILVREQLSDVFVIINAAGPFENTAKVLMKAAIAQGVHYLDFSAEIDTYKLALDLNEDAIHSNVMLMPGSGGSVAMLGCLAGHAIAKIDNPTHIRIALLVSGSMSQGSIKSANQSIVPDTMQLIDGKLVARTGMETSLFDFGHGYGELVAFPATLPDLLAIFKATGVPNIDTYVYISDGKFPSGTSDNQVNGPSEREREVNRYRASVEVTGLNRDKSLFLLDTVNGYTFTAIAAATAAKRVIEGNIIAGYQTPLSVFGKGFVETIADTKIMDISM